VCVVQQLHECLFDISAQVEAELQELEEAEAKEYLQSLGVQEGGLRSLIKATYKQLGLLTYFTTGTCCFTSFICLLNCRLGPTRLGQLSIAHMSCCLCKCLALHHCMLKVAC